MENKELEFLRKETKKFLINEIQKNRDSASYIFFGRRGSNHLKIANLFIKEMLSIDGYSGNLSACPDLRYIKPENGKIKIEKVRETIRVSGISSFGSKSFFVIEDADLLGEDGSNALLKTVEESKNSIFILLTSRGNIIKTIASRSFFVNITPEGFYDDELYAFFKGNMELASSFKDEGLSLRDIEGKGIEEALEEYIKGGDIRSYTTLLKSIDIFLENIKDKSDLDRVKIAEGLEQLLKNKDKNLFLEIISLFISRHPNVKSLEELLKIKHLSNYNISRELALYNFFLAL